ncbi:MAG: DUF2829 domain-containing protein [Deltaproteobacteria bacterium]|nr:DUF2829 domain-containing protein [Deltaproteobacteria bacterium]
MQQYLGVKLVEAKPCKQGDDDGYEVTYPDGYKSRCPKEQFELANRPINGLTFGHAIQALKNGHKVARSGWNGKGMFLYLSGPPNGSSVFAEQVWGQAGREFAEQNGGSVDVLPYIVMKTADNKLVPWLASQTDVLAEDWEIV